MVTRERTSAQASAGRRGRRPLRFAREWAAAGACPSSGPAGPPSPKGEGKGCSGGIHPSRGVGGSGRPRRGGGTPPYVWGNMETLWGLRGHPFPGRRAVGAGHARPGGWREHPSMVRSVGRGLDPSAGVGGSGSLPLIRPCGATFPQGGRQGLLLAEAQGFAGRRGRRPLRVAGNGRRREAAPHPALRGHLPPRGKARAVVGGSASLPPTPASGPRCGAGGSGCSTSGLTKPALYRRNPGRCRGGSRR